MEEKKNRAFCGYGGILSMITGKFQNDELSLLGFGTMRFPLREDKTVDEEQVQAMVDYAMAHGVNYFDTAYPYHDGASEGIIGRALSRYPRESFRLADKYPGHQIAETYDPAAIFEEQLEKCGVEYFDYYLLHNVYERSAEVYMDPKWGIWDYFREQKRLGRIRHLGFSSHGNLEMLRTFLDYCGEDVDFCQIQLNYLDWTLLHADQQYNLLTERGIPVWVMEPVRGGKLAKIPEESGQKLKALRPDESIPAWGFRFLQGLPNVKMILSGMSSMEQMVDNVKTFEERKLLTEEELSALMEAAEGLKDGVPCTACRYCVKSCPMGLDIPFLLELYNSSRIAEALTIGMRVQGLPEDKQPTACIGCGACAKNCPQNIDIPGELANFSEKLKSFPDWVELCREREAARKK